MLSVSREDRGAYTCRAYSIQGEAVHTTRLLVQGEILHPGPSFAVGVPRGLGGGVCALWGGTLWIAWPRCHPER